MAVGLNCAGVMRPVGQTQFTIAVSGCQLFTGKTLSDVHQQNDWMLLLASTIQVLQ